MAGLARKSYAINRGHLKKPVYVTEGFSDDYRLWTEIEYFPYQKMVVVLHYNREKDEYQGKEIIDDVTDVIRLA